MSAAKATKWSHPKTTKRAPGACRFAKNAWQVSASRQTSVSVIRAIEESTVQLVSLYTSNSTEYSTFWNGKKDHPIAPLYLSSSLINLTINYQMMRTRAPNLGLID